MPWDKYGRKGKGKIDLKSRTGIRNTGPSRNPNTGKKKAGRRAAQRKAVLLAGICILVVLLAGITAFATRKNGIKVQVGKEVVAIIKAKNVTAEDLTNTVTAQLKEERGTAVQIKETIITTPVHIKGSDTPITLDAACSAIKKLVTYKVEAAVIMADKTPIAILNNETEADTLLEEIKNEYIPEDAKDTTTAEFVQNVQIEKQFVDSEEIITVEQAREKFTAGTTSQKPYVVQTGDTLFRIAANNDMTVEELLAVNPGMTVETPIRVGQQMNVTVTTPFLSVKTIETVTYTEREPKTVKEQEDSTKPSGYRKVIQQGRDGQSEVTSQIIRVNGFEEERKESERKIIDAPVEEIIVKGTK